MREIKSQTLPSYPGSHSMQMLEGREGKHCPIRGWLVSCDMQQRVHRSKAGQLGVAIIQV